MGSHPINLLFRFLLELLALAIATFWGWNQSEGWPGFVLAVFLPLLLAVIWGVFTVPDDPSRSGKAPVITPGTVRLTIELGIFAFATWALYDMGYVLLSMVFGVLAGFHYAISYDRVQWLLSR
jgi:hypothetical protein